VDHGLVSHGSLPRHGSGIQIGHTEGDRAVARLTGHPEGRYRENARRRIETTIDGWQKPPSVLELRDWMILGQNGGPSKNQTPSLHTLCLLYRSIHVDYTPVP
jgi:hypothetical protein